ncbi:MAG: hypothetical protein CME06_00355 [Gemmatimonadetes bacterium]|nr:hypothetical protein [Gemmatimonadota bacterium]
MRSRTWTLLLVALPTLAHAEAARAQVEDASDSIGTGDIAYRPQTSFLRNGERLEFSLEYGLVSAGTATMEVGEVEQVMGRPCVWLTTRARSAQAFDLLFKVDDRVVSLFDTEELYSWRFERHIREGTYSKDESVIYDPVNRVARYDDGKIFRTPERAQDVLSALYYVRTRELIPGTSILVPTHAERKNYALEVKVLEEESVVTPAGTFDCIAVEPVLQSEGIFRQQGSLRIWLTRDEAHVPVLMKSKVVIGHVTALLTDRWVGEEDAEEELAGMPIAGGARTGNESGAVSAVEGASR